jgi:hypothetical protein
MRFSFPAGSGKKPAHLTGLQMRSLTKYTMDLLVFSVVHITKEIVVPVGFYG